MDGRRSGLWLERSGGQGLHFRFLSARIGKAVNVDAAAAMGTVFQGVFSRATASFGGLRMFGVSVEQCGGERTIVRFLVAHRQVFGRL